METKRKKRLGDRPEGRRLRSLDPINALMPFIFKTRNSSSNFFEDTVEISLTEKYLRAKRLGGFPGMGYLHLFIAGYLRIVAKYPGVNRFVSGQRIYARNNVEFVMVVKKGLSTNAPETTIKVVFDPRDTIDDVYEKLNVEIIKAREERESNAALIIAKAFMKLPRIVIRFLIAFLEFLDYFGIMPKSVINASPFHGSLFITDLGSIGLPPVFHHLYDFGNMPLFIAFGAKRKTREINNDGETIIRKYIDYTFVMDERVCDGFYFSQSMKLFKSIFRNPTVLDAAPDKIVEDID